MSLSRVLQLYLSLLLHYQIAIVGFIMRLGYVATVTREIYLGAKEGPGEISAPVSAQPPDRRHACSSFLRALKALLAWTMAPISTLDSMHQDKEDMIKPPKQRTAASRIGGSAQFSPLLVALVGLPARGKTHVAHRLARHLNWSGESTKVFECSEYRRRLMAAYARHEMFRADHPTGAAIRSKSAHNAVEDAISWLKDGNSIAIFDGTNITAQQRRDLRDHCVKELGFRVLFIECICDSDEIMDRNIVEILDYSPDYKNMKRSEALEDLTNKMKHYTRQYEPIDPLVEDISYIQVQNGGESVNANKLGGQRESGILGFLSNVKPMPQTIYFTRHGESEYNVLGRIGGDANLSPRGFQYARALAKFMNTVENADSLEVWTSEMKRTKQTAEGIIAPKHCVRALNELDAGICEGLTYEEMQQRFPQEFAWRDQDKLRYRYPWGESYIDMMARLRPALAALDNSTNILLVGHQAVLRCVLGYFMDAKLDELPYMNVPLHTIIKLTAHGHKYNAELHRLPVECVDTHRHQPKNCSINRSTDEALVTVPSHYDTLPSSLWQSSNGAAV